MKFRHEDGIWQRFESLTAAVLAVEGLPADFPIEPGRSGLIETARRRLRETPEGKWPTIQAWRKAFASMGIKPTQFRCAAEALLRRLRKEGDLPRLHPLVDLCNAVSVAYGVPIATFDVDRVDSNLAVRPASGSELHIELSGDVESPDAGEIVFVDGSNRTHARRWCHRQSALSIIRPETQRALVVIEAMHAEAVGDVLEAGEAIASALVGAGAVCSSVQLLSRGEPTFELAQKERGDGEPLALSGLSGVPEVASNWLTRCR